MRTKQTLTITNLLLLVFLAGCASKEGVFNVDQHADIPKGSIPEPAGRKLDAIVTQQILSAYQDRLVLYLSDFVGTTSTLSPSAVNRLVRLQVSGELKTSELIIQPSGDETLDLKRVAIVKSELEQLGAWDASVRIATPPALPLTAAQVGARANSGRTMSSRGGGAGVTGGGAGGRNLRSINAPFGAFTTPR